MSSRSPESVVTIALASNLAFFDGLLATAASMAKFADREAGLNFCLLTDAAEDCRSAVENVRRTVGRLHPQTTVRDCPIAEGDLGGLSHWHNSRMSNARLLLSRLLPDQDFVIYCDVDFLWMDDISKLWAARDERVALMAVRDGDPLTGAAERRWFAEHGLKYDFDRYFCSGLCLFNLKMFRARALGEKLIAFIRNHPDAPWRDQTALNALFVDEVKLLEPHWQVFSRRATTNELRSPMVLHYAGDAPWLITHRSHLVSDVQLLWFYFAALTRGESVWKSLRRYYSAAEILGGRGLFLVIKYSRVARRVFDWLLKRFDRPPYQECMTNSFRSMARELLTR